MIPAPNQPDTPIFGLEYGPVKHGKTVNAILSFPTAVAIGDRAAIEPLRETTGWVFKDIRPAKNIEEATSIVAAVGAKARKGEFTSVFVDDVTLLGEATEAACIAAANGNVMQGYGQVFKKILAFRDTAARANVHVWMNAHLRPYEIRDGVAIIGGPALPGKGGRSLAAKVSTIAKVEKAPQKVVGFPTVYRCSPSDTQYISGDRFSAVYDYAPHNAAELFRARGFTIPRIPGCEWQEDVVAAIAEELLALGAKEVQAGTQAVVAKWHADLTEAGVGIPPFVYGAIRDGAHRAAITRARAARFSGLLGIK